MTSTVKSLQVAQCLKRSDDHLTCPSQAHREEYQLYHFDARVAALHLANVEIFNLYDADCYQVSSNNVPAAWYMQKTTHAQQLTLPLLAYQKAEWLLNAN